MQTPIDDKTSGAASSVLSHLRSLLPNRRITIHEALHLAELQAERLLRLTNTEDLPVPTEIISDCSRVIIEADDDLPRHGGSGSSHWDAARRLWVIALNADEPETRQRFTVMHEYKHIIDHYHPGLAGRLPKTIFGLEPAEYVAEYFAGCLLMPKRFVKSAYGDGIQDLRDLAELFDVSQRAMEVRMRQVGLDLGNGQAKTQTTGPRYRRSRPLATRPGWHYRHRPMTWQPFTNPNEMHPQSASSKGLASAERRMTHGAAYSTFVR